MALDLKPFARIMLTGMCIHENSYVWNDNPGEHGEYAKTSDQAMMEAAEGDVGIAMIAGPAIHWSNDVLAWAEIYCGLMIERRDGIPVLYTEDMYSQVRPGHPAKLLHKKGDPIMSGGTPMVRGGTLVVVDCEPGDEAYRVRHNITRHDEDDDENATTVRVKPV